MEGAIVDCSGSPATGVAVTSRANRGAQCLTDHAGCFALPLSVTDDCSIEYGWPELGPLHSVRLSEDLAMPLVIARRRSLEIVATHEGKLCAEIARVEAWLAVDFDDGERHWAWLPIAWSQERRVMTFATHWAVQANSEMVIRVNSPAGEALARLRVADIDELQCVNVEFS